jgi:hypothetical protein
MVLVLLSVSSGSLVQAPISSYSSEERDEDSEVSSLGTVCSRRGSAHHHTEQSDDSCLETRLSSALLRHEEMVVISACPLLCSRCEPSDKTTRSQSRFCPYFVLVMIDVEDQFPCLCIPDL